MGVKVSGMSRIGAVGVTLILSTPLLGEPAVARARNCFGERPTIVGTRGNDLISGTKGNDVVMSLGGDDAISTGSGSDIICSGAGSDAVRAGGDFDRVRGGAGRDTIDVGKTLICIPCPGGPDLAYGGKGDDALSAMQSARLLGGGGGDALLGGRGSDYMSGGRGHDYMDGRRGSDTVAFMGTDQGVIVDLPRERATGTGVDAIIDIENVDGSRFDDSIVGTKDRNRVFSGRGDDEIAARQGHDYLDGGRGNDSLRGGGGHDRLYGKGGTDRIFGGLGRDHTTLVSSGIGVEVDLQQGISIGSVTEVIREIEDLTTTRYSDAVRGTDGPNRIHARGGDDTIDGREGDDELHVGFGNNLVEGGPGVDLAAYGDGVVGDLSQGRAVHSETYSDSLSNIESLKGTSYFDDTLIGNEGDNYLEGGSGSDTIDGRGGNDLIRGGGVFRGHSCVHTDVFFGFVDDPDQLRGGNGNDTIFGGLKLVGRSDCSSSDDGGDEILGEAGDDALFGNQGEDDLNGGSGTDELAGGTGQDACVEGETVRSCERP